MCATIRMVDRGAIALPGAADGSGCATTSGRLRRAMRESMGRANGCVKSPIRGSAGRPSASRVLPCTTRCSATLRTGPVAACSRPLVSSSSSPPAVRVEGPRPRPRATVGHPSPRCRRPRRHRPKTSIVRRRLLRSRPRGCRQADRRAPSGIQVVQATATTWNDGSLGCPERGVMYTQALVDGYHVIVEANGQKLDYRNPPRRRVQGCAKARSVAEAIDRSAQRSAHSRRPPRRRSPRRCRGLRRVWREEALRAGRPPARDLPAPLR